MTTEKLPVALDAERAVLGACLLDRDAILAVRDMLSANDFYLQKHEYIYDALLDCVRRKVPPDLITVLETLREDGLLDDIGGITFLTELSATVPTSVHVVDYAESVAQAAAQRRIIELGGEISALGYQSRAKGLREIYEEIGQRLEIEQRTSQPRPEWSSIDGATLYRTKFEPKPHIIEFILPQGTFLLTGKPKTKKSWLALNYALSVAWGGKALGHFQATRGDVLYVDLEMGQRRVHDRLHVVLPKVEPPKHLHFVWQWPRVGEGCERWLEDWMDKHPYTRLVVFDTQVGIRPPRGKNEEPYEHEKKYMQVLTNLCHDYGIAMLLIHHSRKMGGTDVIDEASGTTGLTAGVDNYGSLSRGTDERDTGVLKLMGRDITIDDDLNMKWDSKIASWCYSDVDYSLTRERREILRLLGEEPGLYPNQIADKLKRDRDAIRQVLKSMKDSGQVVSEDGQYFGRDDTTQALTA